MTDSSKAMQQKKTALIETSRWSELPIRTANVSVQRGSTVFFDTLEQAADIAKAQMAGTLHASTYGITGTQTTFALMDALAKIEGQGHACRAGLMPSGLTAITVALLAFVSTGDRILMTDSVYGPARKLSETLLKRMGIHTDFYKPDATPEEIAALITPDTKILYLESPGSYTFQLQDMPALCKMARDKGLISIVDNAWASPMFARPFDWGVDVSVLPLTKYWCGHSDVLMGAVVTREEHWLPIFNTIRQMGICVGGDDAWLVLRGLRTASVRMKQHEKTALELARWLQQQPQVARVLHPGLPEHPQHERFKRDFQGSSGLFAFELTSEISAKAMAALCEKRRHFGMGYSWGGFESLIMPANLSTVRSIEPWQGGSLVRIHAGLESAQDLIDDLAEGFTAMGQPKD